LAALAEGDQLSIGQREVEISGILTLAEWEERQARSKGASSAPAPPNRGAVKRKRKDVEEEEAEAEEVTARSLVLERIREVNSARFKPFKMPTRIGGADSGIVQPRPVAPGSGETVNS
jgi:hypothetical protein